MILNCFFAFRALLSILAKHQLTSCPQMITASLVYQYFDQLEEADQFQHILYKYAELNELRSPVSQLSSR